MIYFPLNEWWFVKYSQCHIWLNIFDRVPNKINFTKISKAEMSKDNVINRNNLYT